MQKRKILLHIGRHKTGTTAIQTCLFENRQYLSENGFYFLESYRIESAHHELSEYLCSPDFQSLNDDEKKAELTKIKNILAKEIVSVPVDHTIIITSEAFQHVESWVVRFLFNKDFFDVTIVAYFREIVGYVASGYNQEIHAKKLYIPLKNFVESFNPNYLGFAEAWNRDFPKCIFRVFDKEKLENADIVADFFRFALKLEKPKNDHSSTNPSLSRRYLSFKLEYNKRVLAEDLPNEIRPGKLYTVLGDLSVLDGEEKFFLSEELKDYLLEKFRESDRLFFEKYIGEGSFIYQDSNDDKGLLEISNREFWEIYNTIVNTEWT